MNNIGNLFNQNWMGVLIGIVAGVIISYVFYRLSRVRLRIAAQRKSFPIIEPGPQVEPNDVEIFFRGIKVPRVTLSIIAIWNSGNRTIEGSRIVETDPLRVVIDNKALIIEVRQKATRAANAFKTVVNPERSNELECSFDYLDPKDGVRLAILHSGESGVEISGTFRGLPQGIQNLGDLQDAEVDKIIIGWSVILVILGIMLALVSLYLIKHKNVSRLNVLYLALCIEGLYIAIYFIREIRGQIRKPPKELMKD